MATCEWAHLCDYAFLDNQGKTCLIGIFKAIVTARVPTTHTRCAVVFNVSGMPNEEVNLRVQVIRPDGRDPLINVSSPINLGTAGEHTAVLELNNIVLPDFGPYEVVILLDGSQAKSISFDVSRAQ